MRKEQGECEVMTVSDADIQQIQQLVVPIYGQRAWGVARGIGSFVTMEFGNVLPTAGKQKQPRGEWHLWVYCCAWRLEYSNDVLVGSEDAQQKIDHLIKRLEGLTLQSIQISAPGLDTVLVFEQGIIMKLFPIFTEKYEHWMLYAPDGNVLTLGPGSTWSYKRANEKPIS